MELLTVKEAANELELSANRVREYCQNGRLGQKLGNMWVISRSDLDEFKAKPRPVGRPPNPTTPPKE